MLVVQGDEGDTVGYQRATAVDRILRISGNRNYWSYLRNSPQPVAVGVGDVTDQVGGGGSTSRYFHPMGWLPPAVAGQGQSEKALSDGGSARELKCQGSCSQKHCLMVVRAGAVKVVKGSCLQKARAEGGKSWSCQSSQRAV